MTFLLIVTLSTANSVAQDGLGMISEMVKLKVDAESAFVLLTMDPKMDQQKKMEAIIAYGKVKLPIDQFIAQLSADMKQKNSIRVYKKLQKHYKSHQLSIPTGLKEKFLPYGNKLEQATMGLTELLKVGSTEAVIAVEEGGDQKALDVGVGIELAFAAVELGWSIAKDVEEMKGKKVDGISTLLASVALAPAKDLLPGAEKKEEKKED